MAEKHYRACRVPGCPGVTQGRYCEAHADRETNQRGVRRSTAGRNLYKDRRYQKARRQYLAANPWCAMCGAIATDLDHIIPHRGDLRLFWDMNNWQGLCKSCHSKKTAREDGGFGNPTT